MNDGIRLFNALREFGAAVGNDSHRYINITEVAKNRDLLSHIRATIEDQISREFLPGFQFDNLDKFGWHFKQEYYWHRFLLGDSITPAQFWSHWIRRFILPNRYHYRAEIAHALQASAKSQRQVSKQFCHPRHVISWTKIMQDWLTIKDLNRGFSRNASDILPWGEKITNRSPTTLMKWARSSCQYRSIRQQSMPRNYWTIETVLYRGGQLNNVMAIGQSAGKVDTGYLEVWKWLGDKNSPSPTHRSLSFVIPSSPDSWNPPDRHFRSHSS